MDSVKAKIDTAETYISPEIKSLDWHGSLKCACLCIVGFGTGGGSGGGDTGGA
ncbi:MAG: hypothetical protein ACRCYY_06685 [Trueperaceae bacterium]